MSRVTGNPSRRIDVLRKRGVRGGTIAPHRAMIGLEVSRWLLLDLVILPTVFAVAMFVSLEYLLEAWRMLFVWLHSPLGLEGVSTRVTELVPRLFIAIPFYNAQAAWPSDSQLIIGWIVTIVLAVVGVLLRGRALPLGYLLRGIAIIQLSAQIWFTLAEPPFAYTLPEYIGGLLQSGIVILLLSPFMVALTFFVFDFPLLHKFALATLLLLHLAVMIPLQASIHAWIISNASLLAMPVLFLVFGVLLDIFVYVALYGWGMSWRSGGALDWKDRSIPVNVDTPVESARAVA